MILAINSIIACRFSPLNNGVHALAIFVYYHLIIIKMNTKTPSHSVT